ncbi:MAG: CIA30 family protein [Bacteroidales bacterium]|jgi:hypothetical protein|nr:CIA30 family protein [Bacteroidales bacterium]
MKTIIPIAIILSSITMIALDVYDFSLNNNRNDWCLVDDGVIGDQMQSSDGRGIFRGVVSLENNGGFTSIRHRINDIETTGEWQEIVIPFDQMYPSFRGMELD